MAEELKQVRRSGLLLFGKILSTGLKFVTQILIVRYLGKTDYGFFAYGLTLVAFFKHISSLGLEAAIPRFIPIYHENKDYQRLLGTVLISFGVVIVTSVTIAVAVWTEPGLINRMVSGPEAPPMLLLLLILLVPLDTIDVIVEGIWASFKSPKPIFFRRYILAPSLLLGVVALMILLEADVLFLAEGYIIVSAFGATIYLVLLARMLHGERLISFRLMRDFSVPFRELFSFSLPMLVNNLPLLQVRYMSVFLLGYFHDSATVALFTAVLPLANLNRIIPMTFSTMFTPSATRSFVRQEWERLNQMYWHIALWLAVLGLPIFLITFSAAESITGFVFGERYADSWTVLALVSLSHYLAAYLGFNDTVLIVTGRIRYKFIIRIISSAIGFLLAFFLIPTYGATGAAVATAVGAGLHTIASHLGMSTIPGLRLFPQSHWKIYTAILIASLSLFAWEYFFHTGVFVICAMAVLASIWVLHISRGSLQIGESFGEIRKIPVLRWLAG